MSVIKGKNAVLYIYNNGVYEPICCVQNITLTTTADVAETTTDGSGVWKTYRGMRNSWRVACDGLVSLDTNMTIEELRTAQFAFTPLFISWEVTDANGEQAIYQGYVLVENVDTNAPHNSLYKYSASMIGTGELEITDEPIDPNTHGGFMIYKYNGTGSETDGNVLPAIPDLAGMVVKCATRDGVYYRRVSSGAVDKQFTYNDSTTVLTFAADLPPINSGEMIDIFYTMA